MQSFSSHEFHAATSKIHLRQLMLASKHDRLTPLLYILQLAVQVDCILPFSLRALTLLAMSPFVLGEVLIYNNTFVLFIFLHCFSRFILCFLFANRTIMDGITQSVL